MQKKDRDIAASDPSSRLEISLVLALKSSRAELEISRSDFDLIVSFLGKWIEISGRDMRA